MHRHNFVRAVIALLCAILTACGGGSDSNPATSDSKQTVAIGPIDAFGSVFVNGIEYEVVNGGAQATEIEIEGVSGIESGLKLGQVVAITGSANTTTGRGSATSITFKKNIQGPIASINATLGTFTVLGQTIKVGVTTVFDDSFSAANITGLQVNQLVEVSGIVNDSGEIEATRIELENNGSEFKLRGQVAQLTATTFELGTTVVNYAAANLPDGAPTNAMCVAVSGTAFAGNTLTATQVDIEPCHLSAVEGLHGELEGIITAVASSNDFSLGSQPVITNGATRYELNGGTVALGVRVEVEGTFDNSDALIAKKVVVKHSTDVRVAGLVTQVNKRVGTVNILGVTILTTATTQFEDKSSAAVHAFDLSDIEVGDYLEVRGAAEDTNTVTAVRLERDDGSTTYSMRAVVDDVLNPNFTLLGVVITTHGATEYRDANDNSIAAQVFFSQAAGKSVQVEGTLIGSVFVASEVELEE